MVWTAPYGIECARMRLSETHSWEPSVSQIIRIGMDTSKHIFQLHGVDASEQVVLRKRFGRKAMLAFLAKLPPTVVAIEACGAAHHLARELGKLGHTVKLIAPQLVKPYVPRNKNDGRDAEGLCEAASRPRMRFVPVKTIEQQAALMLLGVRDRLAVCSLARLDAEGPFHGRQDQAGQDYPRRRREPAPTAGGRGNLGGQAGQGAKSRATLAPRAS